ncbi:hypothetical protein QCA50_014710 [Cerrena zonata]|uniref:CCHC-type domain-containing protein n=1 Tax=Cerrena zonata TaxID=2478898 RepID=A0AAW0FRC9_9APHY
MTMSKVTTRANTKKKVQKASSDPSGNDPGSNESPQIVDDTTRVGRDDPIAGPLTPQEEEDLYADPPERLETTSRGGETPMRETRVNPHDPTGERPWSSLSLVSVGDLGVATRQTARNIREDADSLPRYIPEAADAVDGFESRSLPQEGQTEPPESDGTSEYIIMLRRFMGQAQDVQGEIENLRIRQLTNMTQLAQFLAHAENRITQLPTELGQAVPLTDNRAHQAQAGIRAIDRPQQGPEVTTNRHNGTTTRHGPNQDTRLRSAGFHPLTGERIDPHHEDNVAVTSRNNGNRDERHQSRGGNSGSGPPGGNGPPDDDSEGDGPQDEEDEENEEAQAHPTARHTRSPTPYGGRNPPSSYYVSRANPQRDTRFAAINTANVNRSSDTDWIRRILMEKLRHTLVEVPAIKTMKLAAPDPYDGKDDVEAFDVWLSQTCRWLRLTRMTGPSMDPVRLDILGQILTGEAQRWYNDVIDNPDRVERTWDFEMAILALYTRFVRRSTILAATERYDAVRYSRSGGAAQLINDLMRHAARMVQPPDDYSIRRRLWILLPEEVTSHLGKSRGLAAEWSSMEEIVRQATQVEDAIRTDQIARRMRQNHPGVQNSGAHSSPPPGQASSSRLTPRNNPSRPMSSRPNRRFDQRQRPLFGDKREDKPTNGPSTSRNPVTGTSHKPDDKGKGVSKCYGCGGIGHFANDPKCPSYSSRPRPAVRRIAEAAEEPSDSYIATEGEEAQEEHRTEGDLEGSQYDPDEYPEEEYDDYTDEEGPQPWMGGIREVEEDNSDDKQQTEWMGRLTTGPPEEDDEAVDEIPEDEVQEVPEVAEVHEHWIVAQILGFIKVRSNFIKSLLQNMILST